MKARAAILLFVAISALNCAEKAAEELPPTGQLLLYVTTDAPLPPGLAEQPDPLVPPPLFDRIRLEIFPPGANQPCANCTREFALDPTLLREGRASIGIVPPPDLTGYVARARLFRAITVRSGEPPPLSTVDVYVALPPVGLEGIVKSTVALRVEDIGRPRGDLKNPTQPRPGQPDPSELSVWPGVQRLPCQGSARPEEACAPGGTFWMGHPYGGLYEDGSNASASRLVTLSPFYVDKQEVTVAAYRSAGLATLEGGTSVDPLAGSPNATLCTYSDQPLTGESSRETLPVNCISWTAADAYCQTQGKTLPSEAEYEYLATGFRSTLFLWGDEQPQCGDSVWGRGFPPYDTCLSTGERAGVLAPGNGKLDRLMLKEGEVVDLAGNLSEWTRDRWNRPEEPCWSGKALLINPECNTVSLIDGDARTVKGGVFSVYVPPAIFRLGRPPERPRPQTGFRCVRRAP